MHTCPPPIDELNKWLDEYPTINGNYGHLLLEQKSESNSSLLDALRQYFESAHLDAREYFGATIGIDLHPDAEDEDDSTDARYPNCLPVTARRGLFGEVMTGLITESYKFVGDHNWVIPVFLFRNHYDVEKYLFDLARDSTQTRTVFGRLGSDFIGLSLGEDGSVVRIIVGEAKWRQRLIPSVIDDLLLGERNKKHVRSGGIWHNVNKDTKIPHGIRQLQRLLQECDPDGFSATILSMDKALLLRDSAPILRTDLVLIVGNDVPSRKKAYSLIPWEEIPPEYTAGNDLQVVEVILNDGEELIDAIYDSLWTEGDHNASE
ncbi:putative aminotransferase protein [Desulfosporosinus sp. I2]|uniref:aminotransferase n=1 Tax=Desulfosporosinus sp. I2 TaxID=1617025 RepID=UPI0005EE155C|nr:aminotransferase [Desulfosporosinus sp. I2]KJR46472.1 putative aminotransferase protein [Desulfosporosinus sp. I2]